MDYWKLNIQQNSESDWTRYSQRGINSLLRPKRHGKKRQVKDITTVSSSWYGNTEEKTQMKWKKTERKNNHKQQAFRLRVSDRMHKTTPKNAPLAYIRLVRWPLLIKINENWCRNDNKTHVVTIKFEFHMFPSSLIEITTQTHAHIRAHIHDMATMSFN